MSTSFEELRDMIVGVIAPQGFDFNIAFSVRAQDGTYIILQNEGWALYLHKGGTWFLDDTSGG